MSACSPGVPDRSTAVYLLHTPALSVCPPFFPFLSPLSLLSPFFSCSRLPSSLILLPPHCVVSVPFPPFPPALLAAGLVASLRIFSRSSNRNSPERNGEWPWTSMPAFRNPTAPATLGSQAEPLSFFHHDSQMEGGMAERRWAGARKEPVQGGRVHLQTPLLVSPPSTACLLWA